MLSIAMGCLASSTITFANSGKRTPACDDPRGYRLVVAADPSRKDQIVGSSPSVLNIVSGDQIRATIKIPTDSDAQGFALDSTKKMQHGFEITIEYGTRIFYRKQFEFLCSRGNFYLYEVKVESFDKFDPVSMNKPAKKRIRVRPNLPIKKFSIFDYL
jgi:hypothetical protein